MSEKNTNWEPDVKKAFNIQKNIKDREQELKNDSDKRKIDGYNPGDLYKSSKK
jgi:hypothetical protein